MKITKTMGNIKTMRGRGRELGEGESGERNRVERERKIVGRGIEWKERVSGREWVD